jgi:hypothetical protein
MRTKDDNNNGGERQRPTHWMQQPTKQIEHINSLLNRYGCISATTFFELPKKNLRQFWTPQPVKGNVYSYVHSPFHEAHCFDVT